MEKITRREVEMAKDMRNRATLAFIDVYLAYLDGSEPELGTDMDEVFRVVWELNSNLRKDFGWATWLYLRNQTELCGAMFVNKMRAVAREQRWREVPSVIGGTLRAYATLAKLALRFVSPFQAPRFGMSDFQTLATFTRK